MRYTPKQNGCAEMMNRTLLDRVKCMIISYGLPNILWGEAMMIDMHIINLSLSTALNFEVPEYMWSRKRPNYVSLRIFGFVAYARQTEGKLERRSIKCMSLGYTQEVKDYRLWVKKKFRFHSHYQS